MFSFKKAALVAATGALLVAPAVASADSGPMVTGSGSSPGNATWQLNHVAVPFTFNISAHDQGGTPSGQFTFTRADGSSFTASVTAFTEVGNEAAFSGPITSGTGMYANSQGTAAYMAVQDNGQGSNASDPDMIQVDVGQGGFNGGTGQVAAPLSENVYSPVAYPYAVASGNIQVHQG